MSDDVRKTDWRKNNGLHEHQVMAQQLTEHDIEGIRIAESGIPVASLPATVQEMTDSERAAYRDFRAAARDLRAAQKVQQEAQKRFADAAGALAKVAAGPDAE